MKFTLLFLLPVCALAFGVSPRSANVRPVLKTQNCGSLASPLFVGHQIRLEDVQNSPKTAVIADSLAIGTRFSESPVRSVVKAFMWRCIAGSVTFIAALRFSGNLATALSIVGSDFFSKSFTMFIGERLMNKSQAGRKDGSDDIKRSLVKALIWRLFAICNTLTMAVFISKDLTMASKIAGSDAIVKTALMFGYERLWARIHWGKEAVEEEGDTALQFAAETP